MILQKLHRRTTYAMNFAAFTALQTAAATLRKYCYPEHALYHSTGANR